MRPSRRQILPSVRRWTGGRPSLTAVFVAFFAAAYVAQFVVETLNRDRDIDPGWIIDLLGLSQKGIEMGQYWQFASYVLLSAGPMHMLVNVIVLYFAGREVEPIVGSRHFVTMFGLGSLVGGLA